MSAQLILNEDTAPAGASSKTTIYMDSADGKLYANIDNTGPVELGGTSIDAGVSFPGTPTSGDYFFRTDLGRLFRYNGATWDTTEVWVEEGVAPAGASGKAVIYMNSADSKLYANVDNGGAVELGGTSIDAGVSFPGMPSAGDYFFRTDLAGLYRYNGTTWEGVSAANTGWKNLVINGAFAIWQRQIDPTTATTYDDDTYCGADRWYILSSQANAIQTSRIDGSEQRYALRLKQNIATATQPGLAQVVEGVNCRHLRGQTVTLRVRVRCSVAGKLLQAGVLEWSGTEDDLETSSSHDFVSTWAGTPALVANMALPSLASYAYVTSQADTWHDLVFTATLGTSFTNLVVFFYSADTLAQNDTLDIETVQVERGPVATPFEVRSYALEFATCQRYYEQWGGETADDPFAVGNTASSTASRFVVLYTPKRVVPTLTVSAVSHLEAYVPGVGVGVGDGITVEVATTRSMLVKLDYVADPTGSAGSAAILRAGSVDCRVKFDGEI